MYDSVEEEIPASKLKNYYKSIFEHKDVTKLLIVLTSAITSTKAEVVSYLEQFMEYQFVWEEDKEKTVAVSSRYVFSLSCFGYSSHRLQLVW